MKSEAIFLTVSEVLGLHSDQIRELVEPRGFGIKDPWSPQWPRRARPMMASTCTKVCLKWRLHTHSILRRISHFSTETNGLP